MRSACAFIGRIKRTAALLRLNGDRPSDIIRLYDENLVQLDAAQKKAVLDDLREDFKLDPRFVIQWIDSGSFQSRCEGR